MRKIKKLVLSSLGVAGKGSTAIIMVGLSDYLVPLLRSMQLLCALMLSLFFFSSCHYSRPDFSSEEMSQKTKDSLNYLYERHYTWNTKIGRAHV